MQKATSYFGSHVAAEGIKKTFIKHGGKESDLDMEKKYKL
jgi:hypothetical protein